MLDRLDDHTGKCLLRVSLGLLLLPHGIEKLFGGVDRVLRLVNSAGLPEPLGYAVFIGELVAPLMLIIGYQVRWAALLVVVNMVLAIAIVHSGDLLAFSRQGTFVLELEYFFLLTATAVMFLGPGRWAIQGDMASGRGKVPKRS